MRIAYLPMIAFIILAGLPGGVFAVNHAAETFEPLVFQQSREDRLERIADRIENALKRDRTLRRYDLDADEEDGRRIELEGTVRTAAERNRALQIARQTAPRGTIIVNRIRVRR